MRIIPAVIALALVAGLAPATGQDFLAPLEEFVETLTKPPAQSQPAPRRDPVTPPPVPKPRPPNLPDVPTVAVPTVTAPVVAEEEEPEAKVEVEEPEAEVEPEAVPEPEVVAEPEPEPEPEPAPEPEPDRVYQVACPAVIMGLVEAEMAPPLSERMCGEQSPLVVTAVMSRGRMVPLSSPVTTNCQMASALPRWVETVDGYAEAMLGSRLAEIATGTSYMCRPVVGGETGRISEHGFANAVDVTGFTLEDGQSMGVEANWMPAAEAEGRLLRLAHDAACAGFTTTLGPEANAEHHDHLHLDLGCHGQSCTARICE